MPATNADTTHPSISDQINESIVKVMYCNFEFRKVSGGRGEKNIMLSFNNDKPPGPDNLNGKIVRIIADNIATLLFAISSI